MSDAGDKWPPTHHEMLDHVPTHKSDRSNDIDDEEVS